MGGRKKNGTIPLLAIISHTTITMIKE